MSIIDMAHLIAKNICGDEIKVLTHIDSGNRNIYPPNTKLWLSSEK